MRFSSSLGLPARSVICSSSITISLPAHFRTHSVMQTFMRMAGAVYTMAGLGTIEESKLFKEKFESALAEKDQV